MTRFMKHIGKHNNKKLLIVYRTVPGEEHMCLGIYSNALSKLFHDPVMKVLESDAGQSASDLADALFRNLLPDGRAILQTLHKEGILKKIPTNQVIITPNAASHVRLDELNTISRDIEQGNDAIKKMAEIDNNIGLGGEAQKQLLPEISPLINNIQPLDSASVVNGAIDNASLANGLKIQAKQLADEAKGLLAESKRLKAEAKELMPTKPRKKRVRKEESA